MVGQTVPGHTNHRLSAAGSAVSSCGYATRVSLDRGAVARVIWAGLRGLDRSVGGKACWQNAMASSRENRERSMIPLYRIWSMTFAVCAASFRNEASSRRRPPRRRAESSISLASGTPQTGCPASNLANLFTALDAGGRVPPRVRGTQAKSSSRSAVSGVRLMSPLPLHRFRLQLLRPQCPSNLSAAHCCMGRLQYGHNNLWLASIAVTIGGVYTVCNP